MSLIRLRLTASVVFAMIVAMTLGLPQALAWNQTYYDNNGTTCLTAGQAAVSDFNTNLALNWVSNWYDCATGYMPQMGTTYMAGDGSTYPYKWSNDWSHGLTDTRTISYGAAICKANDGNGTGVHDFFCETSQ